jgi:hypothetical protein
VARHGTLVDAKQNADSFTSQIEPQPNHGHQQALGYIMARFQTTAQRTPPLWPKETLLLSGPIPRADFC